MTLLNLLLLGLLLCLAGFWLGCVWWLYSDDPKAARAAVVDEIRQIKAQARRVWG